MEHLELETLARLVDEAPDADERRHLSECVKCRTELELLQGHSLALSQLPDMRPPKGDWAVLEARLMSEGLVHHQRSFLASTPAWMKAAAMVILFLGGTGLGMAVAGEGPLPGMDSPTGPFSFADARPAQTVEEAQQRVLLVERQYMDALVQLRQLQMGGPDGEFSPEGAPSRLAALEHLVAAGQAAVQQVPTDPILNGFLASALAERQATYQAYLRQGGTVDDWY